MDGIIKNPIIIGLVAGVITYAYLSWQAEKENKKKKHRKDKEEVNLLIPLVVSVIVWFIAYAYFEYTPEQPHVNNQTLPPIINNDMTQFLGNAGKIPIPVPPSQGYKFTGDVLPEQNDPRFSLLTTGVNVPKNIPDVWLEMF
jgi:heme/copper-type cytochrome/quinol oxidase subunit 2